MDPGLYEKTIYDINKPKQENKSIFRKKAKNNSAFLTS